MLASGATQTATHTHRANSVGCGYVNVSAFIDEYSQQDWWGISLMTVFHTQKVPPDRRAGSKADI